MLSRVTVTPLEAALPDRNTVPFTVLPPVTIEGLTATVARLAGLIEIAVVNDFPFRVAAMIEFNGAPTPLV